MKDPILFREEMPKDLREWSFRWLKLVDEFNLLTIYLCEDGEGTQIIGEQLREWFRPIQHLMGTIEVSEDAGLDMVEKLLEERES